MRGKYWLLIWLCGCCTLWANSQVFYKCTSASGDTTIYLLGTHHQLPSGSFQIDPLISGIMQNMDLVFTEIGQGDTTQEYSIYQKQLEQVFSYPENKSLQDFLSPSQLARVKRFYQAEFSIPERQFNFYSRYRPFMMDYSLKKQQTHSVDNRIRFIAGALNIELRTLDRGNEILNTYSWMAASFQPDSIPRMIDNYTYLKFYNNLLTRAYLNQDTAAMSKAFEATTPESFIEEVLLKRNITWINILNKELRKQNFIAVGVMHVYFRGGLLEYYAGRSYKIESIPAVIKNINW